MNDNRIRRYRRRPRRAQWGCAGLIGGGFVLLFACVLLYVTGVVTPLALGVLGVDRVGDTDDLLAEAPASSAQITVVNPVVQAGASLDFGSYGQEYIQPGNQNVTVRTGADEGGAAVADVTFNEAGLLALCARRTPICRGEDLRFRDPAVDLRPGGAVLYLDVQAGPVWQRVGLVLRLSAAAVDVIGVDVDGSTYDPATLPPLIPAETRAQIQEAVREIERIGAAVVGDFRVMTGGATYDLQGVSINADTLELLLR